MKTPTKVITALALAGLAVAGGAAFTGGGLAYTPESNAAFVGGSIATQVTGATVTDVDYTWSPDLVTGKSTITSVALVLAAGTPVGASVTIDFNDGAGTDGVLDNWIPMHTLSTAGETVLFTDDPLASRSATSPKVRTPQLTNVPANEGKNNGELVVFPATGVTMNIIVSDGALT